MNQFSTTSLKPKIFLSLKVKIEWSIVSNAALKSNKAIIEICFLSAEIKRSF